MGSKLWSCEPGIESPKYVDVADKYGEQAITKDSRIMYYSTYLIIQRIPIAAHVRDLLRKGYDTPTRLIDEHTQYPPMFFPL
jgi:hypothetical protein